MGDEGREGSGGALEYITARMCDPPSPSLLYMSVRRWAGKKEAVDEEEEEGKVHATEPTSTKLTLTIM